MIGSLTISAVFLASCSPGCQDVAHSYSQVYCTPSFDYECDNGALRPVHWQVPVPRLPSLAVSSRV